MSVATQQEFDEFKAADDITLTVINRKNSIKTNFYIALKNFASIVKYFGTIKSMILYVANLIDYDNLIQSVLDKLQLSKNQLFVSYQLNIGGVTQQTVNNKLFQIKRLDSYIIEITNQTTTQWNVDNLMVQIKDAANGTLIYPKVTTKNNSIKIYFIDGLKTDYNVFFI